MNAKKEICLLMLVLANALVFAGHIRPQNRRVINRAFELLQMDQSNKKIVGGRKAYDGEFPYQVSIRNPQLHACGGSIIHPNYILTAAHCLYSPYTGKLLPPSSFKVLAGTNNQYNPEPSAQMKNVSQYYIQEEYNTSGLAHDIAILVLESPLEYNEKVGAIGLGDTEAAAGSRCRVSGWGYLQENIPVTPDELYTVDLTSIARDTCTTIFENNGWPGVIQDDMVCLLDSGKDACEGDSGGPMACDGLLKGVVSFGDGCAHQLSPGVYTNVAFYRNWIRSKIALFDR